MTKIKRTLQNIISTSNFSHIGYFWQWNPIFIHHMLSQFNKMCLNRVHKARIGCCMRVIDFALGHCLGQDRLPASQVLLQAVEICLHKEQSDFLNLNNNVIPIWKYSSNLSVSLLKDQSRAPRARKSNAQKARIKFHKIDVINFAQDKEPLKKRKKPLRNLWSELLRIFLRCPRDGRDPEHEQPGLLRRDGGLQRRLLRLRLLPELHHVQADVRTKILQALLVKGHQLGWQLFGPKRDLIVLRVIG